MCCCCLSNRSSYPDRSDGAVEGTDEDLPDEKNLEYDDETMELTLPSGDLRFQLLVLVWKPFKPLLVSSGAKVGHRSLMRYYRQRFGTQRAVVPGRSGNAVGRVLRQYRALGWAGDAGETQLRHCSKI